MIDKECQDTEYYTPERVLEPVRAYFGGQIDIDPASLAHNPTRAAIFWTKENSGLEKDWQIPCAARIFVNPPYGRELRAWLDKIRVETARGAHVIALLPGQRFEQAYFQSCIFTPALTSICFVLRRIRFLGPDGMPRGSNPYGSMLYLFNGNHDRFKQHLSMLGYCIRNST